MQTYTIKEAAKLSGLPETTLRYYETMWLIDFIQRDPSSKHRTYTAEDISLISSITCLNLSGMSISNMKEYIKACDPARSESNIQLQILEEQQKILEEQYENIQLKREYTQLKIKYWKLLHSDDQAWFEKVLWEIDIVSEKLKSRSKI